MEYKIISDKGKPENGPIMRRYKHFIWLHNRFLIECPGAIMPPLPPKQMGYVEMQTFIEDRRECLEIYLVKAMMNPELSTSPSLDIFLHCSNIIFNYLVDTRDEIVVAALIDKFSDQDVLKNKHAKKVIENKPAKKEEEENAKSSSLLSAVRLIVVPLERALCPSSKS